LKDPFPIQGAFAEGLFEVFAAAAFLPTVADAASPARVIEHPDVSGAGFSGARGEFFDGRLIFASARPLRAPVGRLCRSAPFAFGTVEELDEGVDFLTQ